MTTNIDTNLPICAVCIEPIHPDGKGDLAGKALPCSHLFHQTCIAQWEAIKPTCPLCATEVRPGALRNRTRRVQEPTHPPLRNEIQTFPFLLEGPSVGVMFYGNPFHRIPHHIRPQSPRSEDSSPSLISRLINWLRCH